MRSSAVILLALATTACVAPPMGLGTGAHALAEPGAITTAVGVASAPGRDGVQVDGAVALRRSRRFALEVGGVYSQVDVRRDGRSVLAVGGFPYVRPRFTLGRMSAAVAVSGFMASGGEGGMIGGFADAQLGVGGDGWSIYGGAYALGYAEAAGGPTATAVQARAGVEALVPVRGLRVGLAVELYRQVDSLRSDPDSMPLDSDFLGVGLKLRVETAHSVAGRAR